MWAVHHCIHSIREMILFWLQLRLLPCQWHPAYILSIWRWWLIIITPHHLSLLFFPFWCSDLILRCTERRDHFHSAQSRDLQSFRDSECFPSVPRLSLEIDSYNTLLVLVSVPNIEHVAHCVHLTSFLAQRLWVSWEVYVLVIWKLIPWRSFSMGPNIQTTQKQSRESEIGSLGMPVSERSNDSD